LPLPERHEPEFRGAMNERGYILATNLAKVRIAREVVRDIHADDGTSGVTEDERSNVMRALLMVQERLEVLIEGER
jgi:hypothetical protein